jgi:hypothetical protein
VSGLTGARPSIGNLLKADQIRQRVAHSPIKFNLRVQISESGDKIYDLSIAWPDTSKIANVGIIEIINNTLEKRKSLKDKS